MKKGIAILFALISAAPVAAQSIDDRITALEIAVQQHIANQQKESARRDAQQARVQSDIADLKEDLREIKQGQDAIAKSLGGTFKSEKTWDGQATSFTARTVTAPAAYSSGYSSAPMRGGPIRRLFGRGGCAGGG